MRSRARDSARSGAHSDDSNERQKRDRGSTPGAAAQHRGAVHPLVSSTHRAASADAVARLALASENEQRGVGVEATRIRTKVQATTTQRGAEEARRKRRSSKTTSLRNHEKLRRAVFEHRHHRKAPAELAGP